eukprot:gene15162-10851_t
MADNGEEDEEQISIPGLSEEVQSKKKRKKNKKSKKNKKIIETVAVSSELPSENVEKSSKKRKFDEVDEATTDASSSKKNKKGNKKSKGDLMDKGSTNVSSEADEEVIEYPYEVQPDDHCETPIEAYEDLGCFLNFIAQKLNKTPQELFIYDPFFCEGSMVERMASLGYTNVYNRKEDFYQVQAAGKVPDYDVLMTNPPYSQDHMEKLVRFCTQSRKPFALLVPNYVYTKDYYQRIPGSSQIFYITPSNGRRYLYTTPKGRRQKKSSKYTSPFPTFWFCHIPPSFPVVATAPVNPRAPAFVPPAIVQEVRQQQARIELAKTAFEIPLAVAPDNDPRKKKLRNNLKRKKNKDRKKGAGPA